MTNKYDAIIDVQAMKAHLCFMPPDYLPGGRWLGSGPSALFMVPIYKDSRNQREARQLSRLAKDF